MMRSPKVVPLPALCSWNKVEPRSEGLCDFLRCTSFYHWLVCDNADNHSTSSRGACCENLHVAIVGSRTLHGQPHHQARQWLHGLSVHHSSLRRRRSGRRSSNGRKGRGVHSFG